PNVLPAAARPSSEHAPARARALRHRLSVHPARWLARGLRRTRDQAGGAAADPQGERDPPARTRSTRGGNVSDKRPVVVYGASGFSARLIVEFLREYNAPFLAAGRKRQKSDAAPAHAPG